MWMTSQACTHAVQHMSIPTHATHPTVHAPLAVVVRGVAQRALQLRGRQPLREEVGRHVLVGDLDDGRLAARDALLQRPVAAQEVPRPGRRGGVERDEEVGLVVGQHSL